MLQFKHLVQDLLLHLEVADGGGIVGAHGRTTDCVANGLSGGEGGTAPAQGHCGRIAGRDADVIRRRWGRCQLVSGRWKMQAEGVSLSCLKV